MAHTFEVRAHCMHSKFARVMHSEFARDVHIMRDAHNS